MADKSASERRAGVKTLENKIQNLTDTVNKAIERWDDSARQVTQNQVDIAKVCMKLDNMDYDVKNLEKKSNWWDGINSFLMVIAGIVGFTK